MYKNKELKKITEKKYMETHREEWLSYTKKYREINKFILAEKKKKYRLLHREEISEKSKKYYQEHKHNKKDTCACGQEKDKRSEKCFSCQSKILSVSENNSNWKGGISFEPYSIDWTEKLRCKIRERDNYICKNPECSITEEEHLIVFGTNLNVHHIDYDKQNCQETNLITVCHNCNTRANFNRSYWQEIYINIINNLVEKGTNGKEK